MNEHRRQYEVKFKSITGLRGVGIFTIQDMQWNGSKVVDSLDYGCSPEYKASDVDCLRMFAGRCGLTFVSAIKTTGK